MIYYLIGRCCYRVCSLVRNNPIKASMEEIIAGNIQQQDLKNLLIEFVQNKGKNTFSFGELCIFHYSHFTSFFDEEIIKIAAAIELLVLSFDILDDLEDEDADNTIWSQNPSLSLNGSTALLFLSMHAIRNTRFIYREKAIALMEKIALCTIQGQHKDLLNACQQEDTYLQMIEEKSGSLVSLACLVGCMMATGDVPGGVEDYSKWIGVIGQINNDFADLESWEGKNDMLNKKYSLPIIYLLEVEKNRERDLNDYYQNKTTKIQFLKLKDVIKQKLIDTDALKYASVIKKDYQMKTMKALHKMDFSDNQLEFIQKYMK